jgi:hypothetical protein
MVVPFIVQFDGAASGYRAWRKAASEEGGRQPVPSLCKNRALILPPPARAFQQNHYSQQHCCKIAKNSSKLGWKCYLTDRFC